jgi:GNAT superfamily N-acetyltransferase
MQTKQIKQIGQATIEHYDPANAEHREQTQKLLTEYFPEVFSEEEAQEQNLTELVEEVIETIGKFLPTKRHWLLLCRAGDEYVGFINAQVDSPEFDWNKREGWGFQREIYVIPAYRGQGLSRLLVDETERLMRAAGAAQVYLTSETPEFWMKLGYRFTGEIDSDNDGQIGEKAL